jgi:hypothetical protein
MDLLSPRLFRIAHVAGIALIAAPFGCVPETDVDESKLDAPRVLAVRAEPAEAREGERVTYTALLANAAGRLDKGVLAWFQCGARLPLSELAPISSVCLDPTSEENHKFGEGLSASVSMPPDACALFGPNPPAAKQGEDPGRAVDPDATGGYKVPILVGVRNDARESLVVYEQRLSCNLGSAPPAVSAALRTRYRNNENPEIVQFRVRRADDSEVSLASGDTLQLEPGERVRLAVELPECPTRDRCGDGVCGFDETRTDCPEDCNTPRGCGGAERYLRYDTESRSLVTERESLRFAWYSTAGQLLLERTGLSADAMGRISGNGYTAPDADAESTLFVVVRDARGGTGFASLALVAR